MKSRIEKNCRVIESTSDPVAVELMTAAPSRTRKKVGASSPKARTREAQPAKPRVARDVSARESRAARESTPVKPIPAVNAPAAAKLAFIRGEAPAGPTKEQAAVEQIKTILRDALGTGSTATSGVPSKNASAAEKLNYLRR